MSSQLSFGLSLVALALGAGCAAAPAKFEWASAPVRATCPGGSPSGDAALAAYAGCRRVTGDLIVSNVSMLAPLSMLTRVDGTLAVERTRSDSLDGLNALREVGTLRVESNAELDDMSALSDLKHVARVILRDNPSLSHPDGLAGLRRLDELVIDRSGFLTLAGLEGLERIGRAEIRDNDKLVSVSALNDVQQVDEVILEGNPRLCGKLGVFAGLTTPPGELVAKNNRALRPSETEHLRPGPAARKIAMR